MGSSPSLIHKLCNQISSVINTILLRSIRERYKCQTLISTKIIQTIKLLHEAK